jgi:hypothetical protein
LKRSEETKVKKLISISVILLCIVAVACGQPPNPLLGKWKLIARSGDLAKYDTYCPTVMVFTPTTQTLTYAGKAVSENVTYNAIQTSVYPTTVYVMDPQGTVSTHTTYNFPSKDKVVLDTAAGCSFQRD